MLPCRKIRFFEQVINHSLKPHSTSVVGRIYTSNSVLVEFFNFGGKDYSASASEQTNMATSFFLEQVVHILEILHVSSLIGSNGDCISIFLDGTINHFLDASVMTEMNYFGA